MPRKVLVVSLFWLNMAYGFLCSSFGLTVSFILPRQGFGFVNFGLRKKSRFFLGQNFALAIQCSQWHKHQWRATMCCVLMVILRIFLRYDRKQMQHCMKWFFKLIWTMVSVLRDWKTLALIEVRDSKYFVCHPKITPCSTGINPKQALACF